MASDELVKTIRDISIKFQGDSCPFRHCEAAKATDITCTFWRQKTCTKPNCPFRHSEGVIQVDCYVNTPFNMILFINNIISVNLASYTVFFRNTCKCNLLKSST